MRSSKYSVFDHINHTGHWRQLTVRTTREEGGTMAIVEFVVQETTAVRYFSILLLKIINIPAINLDIYILKCGHCFFIQETSTNIFILSVLLSEIIECYRKYRKLKYTFYTAQWPL